MELWIRSQDKETLMKVNRIDIDDNSIICYDNDYNCNKTYMGQYATKERALEILDEIQHKIDYIYELSLRPRALTTIEHKIVYEMPKE